MDHTGPQIRAARALIGWSARELAAASKVSFSTIIRWESERGEPTRPNEAAVVLALTAAGVEFMPGGVRKPVKCGERQ